jgi:hypothetical protein
MLQFTPTTALTKAVLSAQIAAPTFAQIKFLFYFADVKFTYHRKHFQRYNLKH